MSGIIGKISDKLSGAGSEHQRIEEVPVTKERIHNEETHIDRGEEEIVRDQTKVDTVIQPITDVQHNKEQYESVDHGMSVHERGEAGIDANAQAQLQARRDEIAAQGGREVDKTRRDVSERPNVHESTHTHHVEQVQPVLERDIYNPKVVEHHKKEVEIIHEGTKVGGTRVAPAVTVEEFERGQSGHGHNTRHGGLTHQGSSSSDFDQRGL